MLKKKQIEPVVIQVVGYKKSGKTTLVCQLIHHFTSQGYRVGTIKHDGHDYQMDHPGRDTWKHTQAGAQAVAITSPHKTTLSYQQSSSLAQLIHQLNMEPLDIIFVEGFKHERYPKVVLLKAEEEMHLCSELSEVIAVGSWFPLVHANAPVFAIDQREALVLFVEDYLRTKTTKKDGLP